MQVSDLKQFRDIQELFEKCLPDYFEAEVVRDVKVGVEVRKVASRRVRFDDYAGDEQVNAIYTLADKASMVFVTLTNGDPKEIAESLAFLELYQEEYGDLRLLSLLDLRDRSYLRQAGRVGAVLMMPSTLNYFENVPLHATLADGREIHVFMVTFLSEREMRICNESGADALLDYFEATEKDLIGLRDDSGS